MQNKACRESTLHLLILRIWGPQRDQFLARLLRKRTSEIRRWNRESTAERPCFRATLKSQQKPNLFVEWVRQKRCQHRPLLCCVEPTWSVFRIRCERSPYHYQTKELKENAAHDRSYPQQRPNCQSYSKTWFCCTMRGRRFFVPWDVCLNASKRIPSWRLSRIVLAECALSCRWITVASSFAR